MCVLRYALLIVCFTCICDGQSRAEAGTAEPNPTAVPAPASRSNSPDDRSVTEQTASASPYRLLGILDPDRDRMVAFALKVPREWQAEQSFKRQWDGAIAQNKIYLSLRAPDGRSQIEYLPAAQYIYSEGPQSDGLRARQRSLGLPTRTANNELSPMQPVPYVKQRVLPYLAQNGISLSNVGNERNAPQQRGENRQLKMRGSVDGMLPNGHKARIECRINVNSQQINGDTYYSWSVVPSITQTAGDLEVTHAHTVVAQESIVRNPAWQQLEEDAQNANSETSRRQHEATMDQIHANTAAMTRAHEGRMNDIRKFGEANTARFNDRMAEMDRNKAAFDSRMASQDRQHEMRVDTIREVSKYEDPGTGERVKVEDGYNHVYRNRQNQDAYLGANTPLDAGQVDWQELKKVELKDY